MDGSQYDGPMSEGSGMLRAGVSLAKSSTLKESELSREFSFLNNKTAYIAELVKKLNMRLEPVLRPEPETPNTEIKERSTMPNTAIGQNLRVNSDSLDRSCMILESFLRRMEI